MPVRTSANPVDIADLAIVGDGRTCALISRAGSVDFLCWPRFDSDACCAALLGDERNGCFRVAPAGEVLSSSRRYLEGTAILQTEHETADGTVRVIDFMPWHGGLSALVRIVEGVSGRVPMAMLLRLRFDYGRVEPWLHQSDRGLCAEIGPDRVVLHTSADVHIEGSDGVAQFEVGAGERVAFVLSYSDSFGPMQDAPQPEAWLEQTLQAWRGWIGRFDKPCDWPEAVKRSLITLRLLTDQHTGGVLAAATTGLPEVPGGSANWDYRFCWLRDSTFTLTALLNAGFHHEARRWRDWIVRAAAGQPEHMQICYRLDGARRLPEYQADWLPGWRGSQPVHIGNAASSQTQIDVYGELLDSFHVAAQAGIERTDRIRRIERTVVEHLEGAWDKPGAGIWESREDPQQHTYSQAMAWAGIERYVRAHGEADRELTGRLRALQETIHRRVCERGFSERQNRFVATYDGDTLDASLLLLPLIGFLPARDPRVAATIQAVERELMEGGLVHRKPSGPHGKKEGVFLACSCWLADCFQMQGRVDEARTMLERVIGVANDVGLLSEEYYVPTRQLIGNMPQALSHLSLINTALGLSGKVIQRGGG